LLLPPSKQARSGQTKGFACKIFIYSLLGDAALSGMQGWPLGAAEPRALPPGKILPQYLKDLGYTTRIVGKWHLGYYKREFTPTHRGFDSFLGYFNGFISYYDHINQERVSINVFLLICSPCASESE
jgi:hypothetical protein